MKLVPLALFASLCLFAQIPDFTPPTPLFRAVMHNQLAETNKLLASGVAPDEKLFPPTGFTPLHFAVINENLPIVRALIAKGANPQAKDHQGNTPLMWAAANENASPALVEELLKLGADPHARNQRGENALTWARRRGYTPVVHTLLKAGLRQDDDIAQAAEKAVALLQQSGPSFVKVSGCVSCHHQSLPQMAVGLARSHGLATNAEISKQQVAATIAMYKPAREIMNKGLEVIPDAPITVSYGLLGLHAEGYAPDATTAAMAHLIASLQQPDGSFRSIPARPPQESSDITATALSLRALQLYAADAAASIERAKRWLLNAKAHTAEERHFQLLGLAWAKLPSRDLARFVGLVQGAQHADGGWSQLDTLESDAYATGQALYALHVAGVSTDHPALQRGLSFLLRTQLADGSWLVRTRSNPLQVLKESGFPHGRHQWISAAGTSWAAMALSALSPEKMPAPPVVSTAWNLTPQIPVLAAPR